MRTPRFFVYILASHSGALYTGVTRDLLRRVYQHREGLIPGFTRRYRVTHLVYFEETSEARTAFARERQIKGWSRLKKVQLVESINSGWIDLAESWFASEG
jgi:putative endonuclease